MRRAFFAVLLAAITSIGIATLGATAASAAPQLLEPGVPPGAVLDKADGPIRISGLASFDTDQVLVAIRNNANNRWWHPKTCSGIARCDVGTFQPQWKRSPAEMGNSEDLRSYRFFADLPPGNYQLGLRPVAANGTVFPGSWYGFRVINSQPYERAGATPDANATVNQGLVTITSSHPFGSPISADGPGSARIALRRLSDNRWLRGNGNFQPGYHVQNFDIEAFGPFSFNARKKVNLAPGRYGYWIEHYDEQDVKYSTRWATFTVKSCSNRCANVGATVSLELSADGLCYSVATSTFRDGGTVRLAIKSKATGQWLQPGPNGFVDPNNPTFGSWKLFNASLGQIIQSDPNVGISCLFEDPIALPSGDYFMGVNPFDTAGNVGPGQWLPFTIP